MVSIIPCSSLDGAYLVADDGLLDGGEVLEGGEDNMSPLGAADVLGEAAELLAQGDEDLVLILDGFCKSC